MRSDEQLRRDLGALSTYDCGFAVGYAQGRSEGREGIVRIVRDYYGLDGDGEGCVTCGEALRAIADCLGISVTSAPR